MRRALVGSCGILLTLAGAVVAAPPRAQNPVVFTGTVSEAESGQPLAAAIVRLEGGSRHAATAADGTYRLLVPAARGSRSRCSLRGSGWPRRRAPSASAATRCGSTSG
jgi:hypothetical protein